MEQAEKAAEQQLEEKTKRICTKPGVDYTNLKAEVWDTNKCFGCGAWGLSQYVQSHASGHLIFAIAGLLGGIGLIVYGIRFLRKLKGISFL